MELNSTTSDLGGIVNKKAKYSVAEDLTTLKKINDEPSKFSAHPTTTIEEAIEVGPTVLGENAIKCIGKTEIKVQQDDMCDKNESRADSSSDKNAIKDASAGTRPASVPIYIFGPKPPTVPGLFDCYKCSKNFESQAVLDSHNFSQHVKKNYDRKKPIMCDICDQSFKFFPHLVSHRNNIHRMLNPLYKSTTCLTKERVGHENVKKVDAVSTIGEGNHGIGEDEKSAVSTASSVSSASDPKKGSFSCSECPRTFAREKGLRSHFQYTHIDKIPDGPRPFVCDICNKSFVMGLALGTHRKAVHGKFRKK